MPLGFFNVAPVQLVAGGSHESETFSLWLGRMARETIGDETRHRVVKTLVFDGHEKADKSSSRLSTFRIAQRFVQIANNFTGQFMQRARPSIRWVSNPADAVGQLLQRDVKM